jgi:hypothetical protein
MLSYKEALRRLYRTGGVTTVDLAARLGCSRQAVQQALLGPHSRAHRPPPKGWEAVVRDLARERAAALRELADSL